MPLLNCMVTHCVYNKDELCSRGDIRIGGREARVADETCCDSFRDRRLRLQQYSCRLRG